MSLFRKPKKNIQRRVFSAEDDENGDQKMETDQDERVIVPPAPRIKKSDKKEKTQSKQTLLSFGDEEEGEVFQVKKSSHSKKIMKLLDKERRKKDKEKPDPDIKFEKIKMEENRTEIITGDLVMVVKNREQPNILNGRAALCAGRDDMSDSEDEDKRPKHKFSRTDNVKVVLESGRIPDAAMIHAARKRRQRARELGQEIPLENNENPPDKDKGRLIREDDESDEERIDMTVNHAAREKVIRREQFFAAQDEESEHDTDKEMEEWENQQIRKGVTGAQLIAASQESVYGQIQDIKTEFVPEIIHEPGVLRTPESIVGKLKERLTTVQSSLEMHEGELSRLIGERQQVERDLLERQEKAPVAAQRFRFYQEMRGYVSDLVECFDEKVSVIAGLEQRSLELMGKQADKLVERRRQDVRDQAEEISQLRPGARTQRTSVPDDEARVRRAAEREGRRSRRRRAREGATQPKHIEGMSSDDEITDQESINFKQQKDIIISEAEQVFSDVIEDYATIGSILGHLENWRLTDLSSYTEAYASMCIPKIVAPLIKLSLIFWNPLIETDEIEKHKWFHILMLYGAETSETEEKLLLDGDNLLVPSVIEKIIVPKLIALVDKCWDPMSSSQTLRLVGLIGRYIRKYPTLTPDSKSLNQLFNSILDKLKAAVENDIFIPIFSRPSVETKNPFFQRQFASALKLLRNVSSLQGLVNDKTLKELALSALLNRYLLSGLTVCQLTDAVAKAGLISHILPRVWLQGDLPELGPFNSCVTKLGSQLDKDNPLHLESIEIVTNILKSLRCT